jgi:predicted outer membrane repeat protein
MLTRRESRIMYSLAVAVTGLILGPGAGNAAILHVYPDGSGSYPTIQAAISAATGGDVIELAAGTYTGPQNHDLSYDGKSITVRSTDGNAQTCIIDCEFAGRGVFFDDDEGPEAVLENVTIRNGLAPDNGLDEFWGGGITCGTRYGLPGAIPTIRGCIFEGNSAATGGGALYTSGDGGLIENCIFKGNSSGIGGAVCVVDGDVTLRGCTLSGNQAETGGGVAVGIPGFGSHVELDRCIIASSPEGQAVACSEGSTVDLACCDVWNNAGGDWVGCLAFQFGESGNFYGNPLFCEGSFDLDEDSPCAPAHSGGCGLIGARPVGCDALIVVRSDGSGEYPTIQAAIDAAFEGAIVSLEDGVYTGPGNRDLRYHGKSIVVRSTNGDPNRCIIDCQGQNRGFFFDNDEGPLAILEGVTIRNAEAPDNGLGEFWGGGIACATTFGLPGAIPTIRNCVFDHDHAGGVGGGLYTSGNGGVVEGCVFLDCSSAAGGAVAVVDGEVTLRACTVDSNQAPAGAGIAVGIPGFPSELLLENCIISRGVDGEAVYCVSGSTATAFCTDIWGNDGGDWVGCIAGQEGQNGNIQLDPFYCGTGLFLTEESPCMAENSGGCGLIGARPVCVVADVADGAPGPSRIHLSAPRPNPARASASMSFDLPQESVVRVEIIDPAGRLVTLLVDGTLSAGPHTVQWDGKDSAGGPLTSGIYFCRLSTGRGNETRSIVLVQ